MQESYRWGICIPVTRLNFKPQVCYKKVHGIFSSNTLASLWDFNQVNTVYNFCLTQFLILKQLTCTKFKLLISKKCTEFYPLFQVFMHWNIHFSRMEYEFRIEKTESSY